jgi:hypothetical protein
MKRFVFLVAIGALFTGGAIGAVACGGGSDKPPLTPDSEHSEHTSDADAAPAPSSTSGGSPATPPGK